jgi:hypothetical protein
MTKQNAISSILFMVLLAASLLFLPQVTYADVDIGNARIFRVGNDPRFVGPMVQLDDLAANERWSGIRQFYLSPDLGNSGYATLLTAFSMDQPVWVRIAGDAASGSLIKIIFVNAPSP